MAVTDISAGALVDLNSSGITATGLPANAQLADSGPTNLAIHRPWFQSVSVDQATDQIENISEPTGVHME